MDNKVCSKCGEEKPTTEFYRKAGKPGGLDYRCKACECDRKRQVYHADPEKENERTKAFYAANKEKKRAEYRERYKRNRERYLEQDRKYARENPEKIAAKNALHSALRSGRLLRQPCEECGETPAHAHHDDYTQPLDVRWLCPMHHRRHHTKREKGLS